MSLRVVVLFQRSPIPIREGADRRVAELLNFLATHCKFVGLVTLDSGNSKTRQFCYDKGIDYVNLAGKRILYSHLTKVKRQIDNISSKNNLPNPVNVLRLIYAFIKQRNSGEAAADDPFWSMCDDKKRLDLASYVKKKRIDVVITEYIWLSRCVEGLPESVIKLVDTHDVNHQRKKSLETAGIPVMEHGLVDYETEAAVLNKFDGILAIQEKERGVFQSMVAPHIPVVCAPSGVDVELIRSLAPDTPSKADQASQRIVKGISGPRLLFLGGAHQGNVIALETFLRDIWPAILERLSGQKLTLIVAGNVYRSKRRSLRGVVFLGYVEDLEWLYDAVDMVVNPSFLGSGLKIKSMDALARGKLLITTEVGIDGIYPPVNDCCLVVHSPLEMAESIAAIITGAIDTTSPLKRLDSYRAEFLTPTFQYRELLELLQQTSKSRLNKHLG